MDKVIFTAEDMNEFLKLPIEQQANGVLKLFTTKEKVNNKQLEDFTRSFNSIYTIIHQCFKNEDNDKKFFITLFKKINNLKFEKQNQLLNNSQFKSFLNNFNYLFKSLDDDMIALIKISFIKNKNAFNYLFEIMLDHESKANFEKLLKAFIPTPDEFTTFLDYCFRAGSLSRFYNMLDFDMPCFSGKFSNKDWIFEKFFENQLFFISFFLNEVEKCKEIKDDGLTAIDLNKSTFFSKLSNKNLKKIKTLIKNQITEIALHSPQKTANEERIYRTLLINNKNFLISKIFQVLPFLADKHKNEQNENWWMFSKVLSSSYQEVDFRVDILPTHSFLDSLFFDIFYNTSKDDYYNIIPFVGCYYKRALDILVNLQTEEEQNYFHDIKSFLLFNLIEDNLLNIDFIELYLKLEEFEEENGTYLSVLDGTTSFISTLTTHSIFFLEKEFIKHYVKDRLLHLLLDNEKDFNKAIYCLKNYFLHSYYLAILEEETPYSEEELKSLLFN